MWNQLDIWNRAVPIYTCTDNLEKCVFMILSKRSYLTRKICEINLEITKTVAMTTVALHPVTKHINIFILLHGHCRLLLCN